MSTLYDNFFFNPTDTFGITTSYTVPDGKYARIYPNTPYAFVNGSEIFLGLTRSVVLSATRQNIGVNFTGKIRGVPSGSFSKGIDLGHYSSTGDSVIKNFISTSSNTTPVEAYFMQNCVARFISGVYEVASVATTTTMGGSFLVIRSNGNSSTFTINSFTPNHVFVKEGTVLNGDFTVELFNNPLGV